MTMLERILEAYPDSVFRQVDGFDDCVVGVGRRCSQPMLLVYDVNKMIQQMMEQDGMTEEEAWEFYEFNQVGAWVGELTPIFLERVDYGIEDVHTD